MHRTILVVALAAAALAFSALPSSAGGTGTVTVIHGIPGVTVDVYVDGNLALEDFAPLTVTDPIDLPAGDHTIDIRPAGALDTDPPIITGSASLPAGANASLVAHLTEAGDPTLGVFVNDLAATPAGEGRLVVRHTAAAPAVDVLAGGSPVIESLANPDEATLTLPAGTVSASVAAAGTTEPVIGPADVPVVAGEVTVVYAIGSLEEETLTVVTQSLAVGQEPGEEATTTTTEAPTTTTTPPVPVPGGVPAGGSGVAAEGADGPPLALGAAALILAVSALYFGVARGGLRRLGSPS
jgi:hypothetical protein